MPGSNELQGAADIVNPNIGGKLDGTAEVQASRSLTWRLRLLVPAPLLAPTQRCREIHCLDTPPGEAGFTLTRVARIPP
jgi:hypothetical protein